VSEPLTIAIPIWRWARLLFNLRRRSAGKRESGAFLLGPISGTTRRITHYRCYDDVDPSAYQRGVIAFHADGYAELWRYCSTHAVEILADVHTHPGSNVHQSHVDQRHPMLPVVGHTALIVPQFANAPWWTLRMVGIYEYLGNFKWRMHAANARPPRVKLTLW
jgi:proteasome lid subunit RPN8/RPN11